MAINLEEGLSPYTNLRVLAIDDNDSVLRLVRMVLYDLSVGHCHISRGAAEAMIYLENNPDYINLIICDWNMPGLSGIDFLQKLRREGVQIPFLMLTARADQASVLAARDKGVDAYIVKPFTPKELERKIRVLMRKTAG
jgi:DNA-binding response OmpR family regulator